MSVLVLLLVSLVSAQSSSDGTVALVERLDVSECSVCADGSPSTTSTSTSTTFWLTSSVSLSCQTDFPTNAVSSVFGVGRSNSDFVCQVSQLWAYQYCGCPTPPSSTVRACWICKDGDESYNKTVVVPTTPVEGTCEFQALFSGLQYDHFGRGSDAVALKCPYLTFGMDTWCGCPAETVSLPACTLCGDKTSSDPCKINPLASQLHSHKNAVAGPNFGTCQYYDWLVERLAPEQCTVFDADPTVQFDGFHVRDFCCHDSDNNNNPPTTKDASLCTDAIAADRIIPPLGISCRELETTVVAYLNQDATKILTDPWDEGQPSLQEFCCSPSPVEWNSPMAAGDGNTKDTCQPIPRTQYPQQQSSGSDGVGGVIMKTKTKFATTFILGTALLVTTMAFF
ncbi:expressed unknown protein [Seminavis robusta]|uniref:Uncharacterized protein n=1 Tax=Seminavis robusta TaxID=568900 RepID=A0A9N8I1G4_9STRA|nr:expressed unknown protein [Seminavis robusta]|eukprot:Sro3571_g349250.1 n/a (396) ;mRNA; f:4222-5409